MGSFWDYIGNSVYVLLAIDALWGAYCTAMVWMRLQQQPFRSEKQQDEFLATLDASLAKGDFAGAADLCDGDRRAIPTLALIALQSREMETEKVQELLVDRFQRDVLGDLEARVNWVNNVIKTAPMLGLLGTVLGMMAAFGKLYASKNVEPQALAGDISFALITTAIGLSIAIPATVIIAHVNIRIRKLEELVGAGLNRFFDSFAAAQSRFPARRG